MANPKLLLEIGTIGLDKAIQGFSRLRNATTQLAKSQGNLAGAKVRQAFSQLNNSVNRFRNLANRAKPSTDKLNTALRNLSSTAVLAIGPLSGIGARIVAIGAIASRTNIQLALFFGVLAAGITGFVSITRSAADAERSMSGLSGTIIATGRASELTAQSVRKLQEAVVSVTPGGAIDDLDEATRLLLRIGNVGSGQLERLLRLSADLAEAGFGTAANAARSLANAFQAPEAAIRGLSRVVPVFTSEQRDTIREMVRLGQRTQATTLILEILEDRIGGLAEQFNVGLTSSIGSMQQEFRRLSEELGDTTGALSASTAAVGLLADIFATLRENIQLVNQAIIVLGTTITALGLLGLLRLFKLLAGGVAGLTFVILSAVVSFAAFNIAAQRTERINEAVARRTEMTTKAFEDVEKQLANNTRGSREAARAQMEQLAVMIQFQKAAVDITRALLLQAKASESTFGAIVNSIRNFFAGLILAIDAESDFRSETAKLEESLERENAILTLLTRQLGDLRASLKEPVAGFDDLDKATRGVIARLKNLLDDMRIVKETLDNLTFNIRFADSFAEVSKLLTDTQTGVKLTDEQVLRLAQDFDFLNGTVGDIRTQLAGLISTFNLMKDVNKELDRTNERLRELQVPEFVRGIDAQLSMVEELVNRGGLTLQQLSTIQERFQQLFLAEFLSGLDEPLRKLKEGLDEVATARAFAIQFQQGEQLVETLRRLDVAAGNVRREFVESNELLSEFVNGTRALGDGIVDVMTNQSNQMEALRSTIKGIIDDILKQIIRLTIVNGILNAVFGQGTFPTLNTAFANAATGLGTTGSPSPAAGAAAARNQFGGSFRVGGSGGTDSQMVMLRATPGENIDVTPSNRRGVRAKGDTFNIDARGADPGQIRRLEEQIFAINASIERRSIAAVDERSRRSGRFLSRGRR